MEKLFSRKQVPAIRKVGTPVLKQCFPISATLRCIGFHLKVTEVEEQCPKMSENKVVELYSTSNSYTVHN